MKKPERGLFVTGTDTGVGKTYVACLIARSLVAAGLRVGVYKPAASGCTIEGDGLRSEDVEALWQASGESGEKRGVCPQCFEAPLAPHLAARAEGKEIDSELLRTGLEYWSDRCDMVVVEGAGGLMSPMSDDDYVADLAFEFGYPLVVVAPNVLGVINQTLQTLITAATFRDGIDIAGVVLNDARQIDAGYDDPSVDLNLQELQQRSVSPVLARVGWQSEGFQPQIDWFQFSGSERD